MTKPQQPELHRSGRTPADPASAKISPDTGGAEAGNVGPVPEDNQPGHRPEDEQDKPEGPPKARRRRRPAAAKRDDAADALEEAKRRRAELSRRSAPGSAVTALLDDHDVVDDLFERLKETPPGAGERRSLLRRLVRSLSAHAAVEEQVFYPAVQRALGDEFHVDGSLGEHQRVKESLAELERLGPDDPEGDRVLQALAAEVRSHVRKEETEIFPRVLDEMPPARLDTLGRAVEVARLASPTHPHPGVPNRFPANILVGVPAAVLDRARDVTGQLVDAGREVVEKMRKRV